LTERLSKKALFACIATLFTLPAALIAGRYLRNDPKWFKIHIIFNTITVLLIILVFGLGMGAVQASHLGRQFAGPYSDLHHKVGATVLSVILMQAIIGVAAMYTNKGSFLRRLHVPFGIIVAAGMVWNTWEGIHNEWMEMSTSQTVTPQSVQVIFWVLFLISATAYGIGVGQASLAIVAGKPQENRANAFVEHKNEVPS
jgi:cytochrome b561